MENMLEDGACKEEAPVEVPSGSNASSSNSAYVPRDNQESGISKQKP